MSCCFPKVAPYLGESMISLQVLKKFEAFLPYKQAKSHLTYLDDISMEDSFLVFVSHSWLEDSHPDNSKMDKFKLIIEGISKLKDEMAPSLTDCFIWLDYTCLTGHEKTRDDFSSIFHKIILHCDCMFTPIVDHLADHWTLEHTGLGYFHDYKASAWNGGKDNSDKRCYLNRSWCRLEAFYCSNLPLYSDSNSSVDNKIAKFDGCQKRLSGYGHRPHFLYGNREQSLKQGPINLPHLQNTYFSEYHPMKGHVADESDDGIIQMLTQELQKKYAQQFIMGYTGEYDEAGHQNGTGQYLSANFDVYCGVFLNNRRHAAGVLYAPNGDRYEGGWDDNHKSGEGVMHYIHGDVYHGQWADDVYEGEGTLTFSKGPYLEHRGVWSAGKRHGSGRTLYRRGEAIQLIEGTWSKNHTKGKTHVEYSDGSIYDGDTKDVVKHGKGQLINSVGKYKGDFRSDLYHGRGHMHFKNGDVYNGEWSEGKMHGRGSLCWDGQEYDGHFFKGRKTGLGKIVYADGTSYVGEWREDQRHGKGKLISADESEVKEAEWVDDVCQG